MDTKKAAAPSCDGMAADSFGEASPAYSHSIVAGGLEEMS